MQVYFFSKSDKYVLKRGDTMWWEARSSNKFHEFAIKLHFHYQLTTTQVVICILFWLSKKKSWLDDEPITILRRFSGLMRSSDALRIFFVSIIALPLIISFKPKRRKKKVSVTNDDAMVFKVNDLLKRLIIPGMAWNTWNYPRSTKL